MIWSSLAYCSFVSPVLVRTSLFSADPAPRTANPRGRQPTSHGEAVETVANTYIPPSPLLDGRTLTCLIRHTDGHIVEAGLWRMYSRNSLRHAGNTSGQIQV